MNNEYSNMKCIMNNINNNNKNRSADHLELFLSNINVK